MVLGLLSHKIHYYSLHTGDMVFHISFAISFCLPLVPDPSASEVELAIDKL